ncbi:MAG: dihydroxy-acid dehydratase [Acidobacteria bacterium]|nr:dihydroxy-acid dehydratase [Acidobacteriota bacterium]
MNKYSSRVTQPRSQGASQAMLYGIGLTDADMQKPQVGICSMWYEGNTCNMHLDQLALHVRDGARAAGLVGLRFNTIGVSDGLSMGTEGMSYSLPSRDLIADSIETVMGAQWYDALVTVPGCDKNMPGSIMAMARLNRPSLMVYGGTIRAGHAQGKPRDIISAFQSYGEYLAGTITDEQRLDIVRHACPGQGACGGMYTANTMAVAIEALGLSLPYSSSLPADDPGKVDECRRAGAAVRLLLERDLKPLDILSRKSFENALALVMAVGGSTNAVLHLLAIAKTAGVSLSLDDFQRASDRVPLLADLKPSGQYVQEDLHAVGGTPALMKYLLERGYLHGDCMTVTGKTLEENLADAAPLTPGQRVIQTIEQPVLPRGHIRILRGNLAPDGSVAKITGKEGERFEGVARVFDSEEAMLAGLERKEISRGSVVVIRYEGPKGGPGMPEMLTPTSAIMGAGLGKDVAMLTDGRFSGGSHGFIIGHITPEAQDGGPIALIKDGDRVVIDAVSCQLHMDVSDAELASRRAAWKAPGPKATSGVLGKYVRLVRSASDGCVTD